MSDVVTCGVIPAQIREDILVWVGCIAGALDEDACKTKLAAAGCEATRVYKGEIRPDGLVARDFYLLQIKSPADSKSDWDLYRCVCTVAAAIAPPSLAQRQCPPVAK